MILAWASPFNNMTIWCKHVHKLQLQLFLIFVQRIYQLD